MEIQLFIDLLLIVISRIMKGHINNQTINKNITVGHLIYKLLVRTWRRGSHDGGQEKSISLLWELNSIFM